MVEVLIAILIVTLVLITVVTAVLMAIRSAKFSQHKARATFLAQEGLEWVRSQRQELGWGDFAALASLSGASYCLDTLILANPGTCGPSELVDGLYARSAVVTLDAADPKVSVLVTVVWLEGNRQFSSQVTTTFSKQDYQN